MRANQVAYGLELLRQDEDTTNRNPLLAIVKAAAAAKDGDEEHEDNEDQHCCDNSPFGHIWKDLMGHTQNDNDVANGKADLQEGDEELDRDSEARLLCDASDEL